MLITGCFAACNAGVQGNKQPTGTKDTLTYSYKTFKQRDADCGNSPDSTCTIVKINYPDFDGKKALNDSVTHSFIKLFATSSGKTDTGYNQLADNFIGVYKAFKKDQPKSTLIYLLDGHAKVLKQDSTITRIEVSGYSYHGGPHGIELTSYVNWDTKANKSIALNDIFVAGYQDKLNRVAERIFRKNEGLKDTATLNNGRTYFFKDNKFNLPANYLITSKGIQFLYNVYTIKPYAADKTELLVPYTAIKILLLLNSVVKNYIK
ncbi:Protein of unknown function [Mucilaginibacter mallensis]|uniref:DUF3298 domain-containing protein n=1 Tax=Mucilaginibacter mallensis TaxID=652787 RepID=A0A1H1U5T4_MUCMA|nr:RsiV family protein [Mucilaginibacter mallensis]SDS67701.1 Protein of unknown function [Mucilaginibacter mallensis]